MSLSDIVTPLDAASLNSSEQYKFYHKMVDHVLKELIEQVKEQNLLQDLEITFFKQYCELLIYSIDAMRIKYMYDEEENMKIDLTDSGFPNYLEFRYLVNDLSLKENYINKLTNIGEIKKDFLNTLIKEKQHVSKRKMYQATSIVYYTTVEQRYIFKQYIQGKIKQVDSMHGKYVVSWSFYDITYNRPFICFMYFDYKGKDISDYTEKIYDTLQVSADRSMNLDSMAFAIDKKLHNVFPKLIKRIDLGPLHNVFAKDENSITHAVLKGISAKTIDLASFVLSFKIDSINSKSSFKEGSFLSKQELQVWHTKPSQKYLFTTHRVMQMLYAEVPQIIDTLNQPPIMVKELILEGK